MERPLFWSAAALVAGMVFLPAGLPSEFWGGCALAALGGAVCLAAAARTISSARLAFLFLLAGFGFAGGLSSIGASHREPYDIATLVLNHPALDRTGVEAAGTIAREPMVVTSDARGVAQIEMLVDVRSLKLGRSRMPCEGRVRFRMPLAPMAPRAPRAPTANAALLEPLDNMRRGARVTLFGRIAAAPRYGNEGSFDYARYLSGRGIEAVGTIKSPRLVTLEEPSPLPRGIVLMRKIDGLRSCLLRRIDVAFDNGPQARRARAVAAALLLGERWGLDRDDALALQEAGLTHLLAVSGFNVAVLAGILLLTLRSAGCGPRAAALAILPVLSLYLLLNREESSVVRAVIMASAWLGGRLVWRRPDLCSMLGLSALAILAVAPAQVDDPGFQLTYCATLSLILLARLFPPFPMGRPGGVAHKGFLAGFLAMTGGATAATLAALVGTLPLTITHFNRVTPGALPANLLAGPMMAAAFIAVIALVAVPPPWGMLSHAAAEAVLWLVNGSFMTADAVRRMPAMAWRRPTPGMALSLLYYTALIALLWVMRRGTPNRRLTLACLVAAVSVSLLLISPLDTRSAPDGLRLTMLDVGQGDSMLIETPSRRRLLIDAGGSARGEFDVGDRVVSAALWHAGIARLDVAAVTHEDTDHIGGMAAVVRNFRPKEVWLPAGWEEWPDRPGLQRLRAEAKQTGAVLRQASRGDQLRLGEVDIEVLNPPCAVERGRPDNERSFVLEARLAGRTILLAGDAGGMTESELASLVGRADLLKVGHHGSRSSSTKEFLAALRPKVAAISCGRNNRFGHPHPEVVGRLSGLGARICRTDEDGAFAIELLGHPVTATRLSESCALAVRRPAIRTPRERADGG